MKRIDILIRAVCLIFAIVIAISISKNLYAASGAPCGHYLSEDGLTEGQCESAEVDSYDISSLQRGAVSYTHLTLPTKA